VCWDSASLREQTSAASYISSGQGRPALVPRLLLAARREQGRRSPRHRAFRHVGERRQLLDRRADVVPIESRGPRGRDFRRLARRICADCKIPDEKHPEPLAKMGMTEEQIRTAKIMKGRGCNNCNQTGYKGRVALYEVMPFVDSLRELVLQGASAAELKAEMIRSGYPSLRMSGIQKILEGVTTPEEVLRTTVED
jgi:hypothetical protein